MTDSLSQTFARQVVMAASELSRRAFLARIGVLGASATLLPQCVGPEATSGVTGTAASELSLGALVGLLRPVLGQLARDTLNGFIAFVVPGQDAYSRAQGTPRGEPGGIEAGGTDFLIENLDRFLAFPDALARTRADQIVIDLVRLPICGSLLKADYRGLCW